PRRVVAPPERRLDRRARAGRALEHAQREVDGEDLRVDVERTARGVAEREIAEEEAGNAALLDDVLGAAHDHGRNTVGLEGPGDQTHGLVTDRSARNEEGDVRRVLLAAPEQLG